MDTQNGILNIQQALTDVNRQILCVAREVFPDDWTSLTPNVLSLYSWVGYDIDGRTDISWGDAIRLRLSATEPSLFPPTTGLLAGL